MDETDALLEELSETKEPRKLRRVIGKLNDLDASRVVEPLIKELDTVRGFLDDPKLWKISDEIYEWERVMESICEALGELKDEKAVLPLIELIESYDRKWTIYAILSLGEIGDKKAVPALIMVLENEKKSKVVREYSAKVLGRLATRNSIEALFRLIQNEDGENREIAVSSLYRNIKYGSEFYKILLGINNDVERVSTQSKYLQELIDRDAGFHSDGSIPFSENPTKRLESEREIFFDSNSGDYYYIDDDGEEIECDNLGRSLYEVYLPSHFKGWNPVTKNYFDKLNKDWASHPKFKELGNCFESILMRAFKDHGLPKLSINKNRPNTQGGSYLYKRFVRVYPNGFKPNGIQVFIESFCEETQMDSNRRDPSDEMYNNIGFPIPKNSMGVFVGMSAILYFENGEKWGIEDSINDFDIAKEFFYEIEEKMEEAKAWAAEFTESEKDFVTVQDERVQRIRIKLPNLSLDSNNWEDCKINEALTALASIFGELFAEYSIE